MFIFFMISCLSLLIWIIILLLPSKGYRYREVFTIQNTKNNEKNSNLPFISVIIPARNEEAVLEETLPFLLRQDYPIERWEVILVNDQSTDNTKAVAEKIQNECSKNGLLRIIDSQPLAKGWAGKMWALHQGIQIAKGDWILLTDADLQYSPGLLKSLIYKTTEHSWKMFSLMARLKTDIFWEKLLIPAFLYFFKLMYPFQLVQKKQSKVAAAAGGCILIDKKTLESIGGIQAIQGALIDDISLAKVVKKAGNEICLMDAPNLKSMRGYDTLSGIWNMVARSAFTELKYSYLRLFGCILIMLLMFAIPLVSIIMPIFSLANYSIETAICGLFTWILIICTYAPSIFYFHLSFMWAISLPFGALLYLCMTIDSAFRYLLGTKATWKGRDYSK